MTSPQSSTARVLVSGPVADIFTVSWWLWIVLPCLGAGAYLARLAIVGRRRTLPPLDRTRRTGIIVEHR